jgi:hypothetical protein
MVAPYPPTLLDYEKSLPFVEELMTHTFVKSNYTSRAGEDPYLNKDMTCAVVYTVQGTTKKVGQFKTGNCTLHIQLKGSQAGYEHEVKKLLRSCPDHVYRVIDSGRQIRDPNCPDERYDDNARSPATDSRDKAEYVYLGMIDHLGENKELVCSTQPGDSDMETGPGASTGKRSSPESRCEDQTATTGAKRRKNGGAITLPPRDHPQIPREQYVLEHPEFILKEHNVGVSGPLTCQLRTDSVTAKLLGESQDTPVEVVVCDKTNHDHPVLLRLSSDKGKLPRLLEGYNEEEVRSALGIESTRIAKRCIREAGTVGADGTFLESPGVILHREYKQDLQSVVEAASDVFAAEHGISGYSPLSGERGLITYSSGGSTAKAGANAASLAKMRIEDELVTIPGMPTVDKGLNKHLLDHCVRSTVLAVFLPGHILRNAMTVYKKHVGDRDLRRLASGFAAWAEESVMADAMYFMGYHVVAQTRINNPRYPFLRRDAKFEVPMNEWTTFKDRVHLEFELRPVVTHQRYIEVRGVERRGFRVKDDKEYKLFCAFGAGEDLFAKPIGDVHQEYIDKYIMPSVNQAEDAVGMPKAGEQGPLGHTEEEEEDDQAPFRAGNGDEGVDGTAHAGEAVGDEDGQRTVVDFQPSKLPNHYRGCRKKVSKLTNKLIVCRN